MVKDDLDTDAEIDVIGKLAEDAGALLPALRDPETDSEPRLQDVDHWGRSEHMREFIRRAYDPVYRYWFRAELDGLENVPRDGGALLVANHAGSVPSDAPVIMHGIEEELGRPLYGLAEHLFRTIPVVGTLWARGGGVAAHPDNAHRLLHDEGQLALVFPEGAKGPGKTYAERYRLRRFGRGGFIEVAMRAGVPVVPIAVMGAEESMPNLTTIPGLAKAFGLPYVPITPQMLAAPFFGPLAPVATMLYLPAKFRVKFLPPVHFPDKPNMPRYSKARIMEYADLVRDMIQAELFEMLRARRSVWFG